MTTRSPDALPSADRLVAAAEMLVQALKDGERIARRMMNAAMADAFGTTSSEGVWAQRDSFQMVETAVMLALPQLELPRDPVEVLDTLAALEARQPTQTVRSEEQISHQHFSTPLGLAWLVAQFADFQPDDHVLEPSAGTGMLAIWARRTNRLHLNEIDPLRQAILQHLFPDAAVTGFDAARIGAHLEGRPSVVLMNPPFARNAAGQEDAVAAARHLAAALGALQPGGRLVSIMPDGFQSQGRQSDVFKRVLQGQALCSTPGLRRPSPATGLRFQSGCWSSISDRARFPPP